MKNEKYNIKNLSKKRMFKRKVPLNGGQVSYGLKTISTNKNFRYKQGVMSINIDNNKKYKINWSNNDNGYEY
jgi:DUF2075 family protein